MPDKKIETKIVKINEFKFDENNANKGTERGRYVLEKSLTDLGTGRSIVVDKDYRVIAGNKSLEVYGEIGLEDVIVIPSDGKRLIAIQRTDLSLENDEKAKQLAIADNRTSELSLDWDSEALALYVENGVDLGDYFSQNELDKLLEELITDNSSGDVFGDPPPDNKDINEDELAKTNHECPSCGYKW